MILLLTIMCIVLCVICYRVCQRGNIMDDELYCFLACLFGGLAICFMIASVVLIGNIRTEFVIDERISMYEEQNAEIESKIEELVANYMSYEQDTFEGIKNKLDGDVMVNISMFPELKSDQLVAQQVEVHTKNKAKIIELKEKKLGLKKTRWWLYFGH